MTIQQQINIFLKNKKYFSNQQTVNLLSKYFSYNSYIIYEKIFNECNKRIYSCNYKDIDHDDIYNLFIADKRLRLCLFNAIEEIETVLKVQLFDSLTKNNLIWTDKNLYGKSMFKINTSNNKDTFTFLIDKSKFKDNRDIIDNFYFSDVMKIFTGFDNKVSRTINTKNIAQLLGFQSYYQAKPILLELRDIRNKIAHHELLIDYIITKSNRNNLHNNTTTNISVVSSILYKKTTGKTLSMQASQQLCLILYWVDNILDHIRNKFGFYSKITYIYNEYLVCNKRHNYLKELTSIDDYLIICR